MDKSSTEVSRLTLWGSNAETLDLSNAPILAAKNVRVSAKDDSLHLSETINVFLDLTLSWQGYKNDDFGRGGH